MFDTKFNVKKILKNISGSNSMEDSQPQYLNHEYGSD